MKAGDVWHPRHSVMPLKRQVYRRPAYIVCMYAFRGNGDTYNECDGFELFPYPVLLWLGVVAQGIELNAEAVDMV